MKYTGKQLQALKTMMTFRRADRVISLNEGKVCREYGITPIQFGVMETLYRLGELQVGQLIDELLTTPAI